MRQIIEWSQGNPDAMMFLMKFLEPENMVLGIVILSKLEKCPSIRGTNLYVLWSDLCNKDLSKVKQLCKNCPDHVLENACARQDYSGRELVAEYFDM